MSDPEGRTSAARRRLRPGRGRGSARALPGRRDRRLGWGHRGLSRPPRGGPARLRHGVRHDPAPVAASREPCSPRSCAWPHTASQVVEIAGRYAGRAEPRLRDPARTRSMTIHDGVLRVASPVGERSGRPRADRPVPSLARRGPGRARHRIVLSGTGSDGTLGLRAIKEHGGMTMAQAPTSAKHDSMPRSAIATGLVDPCCRPRRCRPRLAARYLRDAGRARAQAARRHAR